jgi:hypothetical protein
MFLLSQLLLPCLAVGAPSCPDGTAAVDSFAINGTAWIACEDLQQPAGSIALVSTAGCTEWFSKGYEVYASANDEEYYLGLGKSYVTKNTVDVLVSNLPAGGAPAVERVTFPLMCHPAGMCTDCLRVSTVYAYPPPP